MTEKNNKKEIKILNEGCFDLQFRRDVRHKRPNKPTYYRWKAQFVIVARKKQTKLLEEVKGLLGCGEIYFGNEQIRYSVQDINDLYNNVVSFFQSYKFPTFGRGIKTRPAEYSKKVGDKLPARKARKKKDFKLWAKAVEIIYRNKRKNLAAWKKKDFQHLIEIQKIMPKYKEKPKNLKWLSTAESIAKTLRN